MNILLKVIFLFFLMLGIARAEYYLVYPAPLADIACIYCSTHHQSASVHKKHKNHKDVAIGHHYKSQPVSLHPKKRTTQPDPLLTVVYPPACDSLWVPGCAMVESKSSSYVEIEAQPYPEFIEPGRQVAGYPDWTENQDMRTQDDDVMTNPDMYINDP